MRDHPDCRRSDGDLEEMYKGTLPVVEAPAANESKLHSVSTATSDQSLHALRILRSVYLPLTIN